MQRRAGGDLRRRAQPHPARELPGEVYSLYLLEEVWRRGIGRALFGEALSWLAAHQGSPAIVWALSENAPACGFYLSMGGILAAERVVTIGARPYRELGFVYRP